MSLRMRRRGDTVVGCGAQMVVGGRAQNTWEGGLWGRRRGVARRGVRAVGGALVRCGRLRRVGSVPLDAHALPKQPRSPAWALGRGVGRRRRGVGGESGPAPGGPGSAWWRGRRPYKWRLCGARRAEGAWGRVRRSHRPRARRPPPSRGATRWFRQIGLQAVDGQRVSRGRARARGGGRGRGRGPHALVRGTRPCRSRHAHPSLPLAPRPAGRRCARQRRLFPSAGAWDVASSRRRRGRGGGDAAGMRAGGGGGTRATRCAAHPRPLARSPRRRLRATG